MDTPGSPGGSRAATPTSAPTSADSGRLDRELTTREGPGTSHSGGLRPRGVEEMPAGGTESERLQPSVRGLSRVDLREPNRLLASRAQPGEQLLHAGSTIVDQRTERENV